VLLIDNDMAAVAPPADQASQLLQKLSLDTQPKVLEITEPTKKPNPNQYGSVDSGNAPNSHIPPYEQSLTPLLHDFDPAMCYIPSGYPSAAYYYGGYEGTGNEWEDFSRYGNAEGVDMTSAYYGDNGSVMYHGYGFAPYSPYSPATSPVPGNDQLYGTQHYHYPLPYFQPTTVAHTPSLATPMEVSTSAAPDQKPLSVDSVHANANQSNKSMKGNNKGTTVKSTPVPYNTNGSFGRDSLAAGIAAGYQDPRFAYDGLRSPLPWSDGLAIGDGKPRNIATNVLNHSVSNAKNVPSSKNQNYLSNSHFMGLQQTRPISGVSAGNAYINRMYPNKLYGQYGSTISSGMGYGPNIYDTRTAGNAWQSVGNKYRNRQYGNGFHSYGNENIDGLNELNRGPRAKSSKNQKVLSTVSLGVKGQTCTPSETAEDKTIVVTPDREQLNRADFPEKYADAKFFIIKSYSEDDVHKSMKYNVWASTPNGNKKLDAAYRESQEKASGCPIFLFFSVNTSGQFVGLAEMLGPVDFHKNVEYWQQDKWNGCFPVKWHIVKDVPNSMLKHIILENNENKPVTNSRDTQEVKLEQGLDMIKIFKDHSSKTCLLDDFEFYENRQKAIQEKKAKQHQYQKQAWEGNMLIEKKDVSNGEVKHQQSVEAASDLNKENVTANGKIIDDGTTTLKAIDGPNTVPDNVTVNGVANAC
jgi:translation initiation factor IF-3